MTELALITLENEMDLTLAYKRSIRVAELLALTISTQTAFATAVSEVCREMIDKTLEGSAVIGASQEDDRFFIVAKIHGSINDTVDTRSGGFEYARKLVPILEISQDASKLSILLKLGIPRATRVDKRKVAEVKGRLIKEGPISAYEEVKMRNAELHQLNEQRELDLVHSQNLNEQKNEFLSIVSHELNTPLTVLRSYVQIVRRIEAGKNESLSGYLNKIELQTTKLTKLIKQLLDISKIEQGKITYQPEETTFNAYLTDIVNGLIPTMPTHTVTLSLGNDCNVTIDRLRVEQVLNNLIGNAAKYSANGSCIIISTHLANGFLNVSVQDEGIGMSADTVRQVFQKFYRNAAISKRYSGLGMGLYIASRIVTDHKGSLDVKSEEEKGSVFTFMLPLSA